MPAAHLIDTNILLRLARRDQPEHGIVRQAMTALAGTDLYYTHQNIAEFWNVATRPVHLNGFGLPLADVDREVTIIERLLILLPEDARVYHEWRRLVVAHSVSGAKVHDARLVAAMRVHGITHLLTLNTVDFKRYDGIIAVHPSTVQASHETE